SHLQLLERSPGCPSGSGSCSFCATTPISTTGRSRSPFTGAWVPTERNIRARGPNGATAELQITRGTKKLGCWIVRFSSGQPRRGCKPLYPTGPWVEADLVQAAGRDLFVVGNVRAPVKRVRLEFADGG